MPPMASFAFRGTAREFTLYPFVALTPNDAGIAYIKVKLKPGTTNVVKLKSIQNVVILKCNCLHLGNF